MITQAQHRQIDADMAVRLVHWLMDTKDIRSATKQVEQKREQEKRLKRIASAYSGGMRTVTIAKEFGVTHKTIKQACTKHGIPMRRNSWRYE